MDSETSQTKITTTPLLPFTVERPNVWVHQDRYREAERILQPLVQTVDIPFWERVKGAWKGVRFGTYLISSSLLTIFKVKVLNNDKKTTIIGWVEGILKAAVAIFLPDLVGADNAVVLAIQLITAGSALFSIIQGWLSNKPE